MKRSDSMSVFERCRGIAASEAARREGLELKKSGNKEMARCPFHGEKTASLWFYEDGHYHCYGCGAHGDAVSFVSRLRGIGLREAAERLLGGYGGTAPPPPPRDKPEWLVLMAELEAWHKKEWDAAMELSAGAVAEADMIRAEKENGGDRDERPPAVPHLGAASGPAETGGGGAIQRMKGGFVPGFHRFIPVYTGFIPERKKSGTP